MKLLNWVIGLFRKKEKEYLYLYEIPALTFEKDSFAPSKSQQNLRHQILTFILHDVNRLKKTIGFTDVLVDTTTEKGGSITIMATASPQDNPFLMPLVFEIYAYKTKKDLAIFTYPYETLLFKINTEEIKIQKFFIEC